MDTFHLTRETETDTLECFYISRIEAWTVDDWTRDTTVHLNHRDLMSYASFNNKTAKLVRFHGLQKQFSHFSRNNQIS